MRQTPELINFTSKLGKEIVSSKDIFKQDGNMAQEQNKYTKLISEIKKGIFKPVYLLMGEEPYYIDMITDAIVENALDDSERDFNQTILYGNEAEVSYVINAAKRYPMMAPRQLIVIKEAQNMDKIDALIYYMQELQPATVLVLNYKGKNLKDKKLVAAIEKVGLVVESKKIYDSQLPSFINDYVAGMGMTIGVKAVSMLADYIGNDLNRMAGELQKLKIVTGGREAITPEIVEANIGISKDYNNFELLDSVINKDYYKVAGIVKYFEKNPKNNPLVLTISVLFNFFSNLMILYYAKDKSDAGIAKELNMKSQYYTQRYRKALQNYSAYKCVDVISYIREYDAKSKGVGVAPNTTDASLLKELLYKIMH